MKSWLSFWLFFAMGLAPAAIAVPKPWQTLEGCVLMENAFNDGDSFHVYWNGNEFVFRIYYVDCPESDRSYPDRLAEQAAYFGISVDDTLNVGKQASAFTKKLLGRPFTIRTRWQYALGRSRLQRNYGFIQVDGRDLAELLAANGLARIHGVGIGRLAAGEKERLRHLEEAAKSKRLGAWTDDYHAVSK